MKKLIESFERENCDVKAVDHNSNYDYRFVEFLVEKIDGLNIAFDQALATIGQLTYRG